MKRIKIEEVKKAFEVTGLKPKKGKYFQNENNLMDCACGLGALYLHEVGKEKLPEEFNSNVDFILNDYFDNKYGKEYRLGFVRGFDNDGYKVMERPVSWTTDKYCQGYADGEASRKALNIED